MANENEGVQTTATTTEQTKYLDKKGLETFWGKVKALVTAAVGLISDYTVNGKKISTNPVLNKVDIGLGNVDNTSDTAKPVSTAQATAIADAKKAGTDAASALADHKTATNPHNISKSTIGLANVTNDAQVKRGEMGKANGVATLDANGRVPLAQLGNLDTSLYIIPADNKLPTTGIKTNKIYLIKETSGTNNVYTEYIYVNSAWEKLGQFKADVDLTPYAKLAGGNTFTGTQTVKQANTDYRTTISGEEIKIGKGEGDLTIGANGISIPEGSNTEAFATDGTTINMGDYVAKSTYNTDKTSMTTALNNKLDKIGGTISGNLAVTGTLKKGGKDVLTDHQAIYSLTVQKNGSSVGTFNPKSANATINVTVPTKLSGFTDDVVKGKYLPLTGGRINNVGNDYLSIGPSGFDLSNDDYDATMSLQDGGLVIGLTNSGDTLSTFTHEGILVGENTEYQDGTINYNGKDISFPAKAGTIALTSDIPTGKADKTYVDGELKKYLPLNGGTLTGLVTFTYNGVANRILFDPSAGKVGAQSFVKANATAKQLLCGDGTVAERIDETEIAAICV